MSKTLGMIAEKNNEGMIAQNNNDNKNIIAIGDLHGDFEFTIETLKLAKVIREGNKENCYLGYCWDFGDNILVQTGDIVDRFINI